MAFPPAFSNAWDNTFPPDTQLANQLGADLRSLRTDAQQRFALQSGLFANRPSNMDATFGGAGFGILYWSTDTFQVFQWNSAVWVDITQTFFPPNASLIIDSQASLAAVVGDGTDKVVYSKLINAATVSAGKGIRITIALLRNAGAAAATFKLKSTAGTIETITYAPINNVNIDIQEYIIMNAAGSSVAQTFVRRGLQNMSVSPAFSVPVVSSGLAAIDWTANQTVSFTCNIPGTDQFTPVIWLIENIH